jgi:uncharacterized protein (TIGR02246 family)
MDSDTRTDEEQAADERAIRALHGRMLEAWGAGDGDAFAAPFSDDAVFIGFDGSVMRPPADRVDASGGLRSLDERHPTAEEQTEVSFPAPDVAIVHALGGTVMRGKSEPAPERDSIQTLVAARDAGGWSFVSFQNTRLRPITAGAVSALLWLVPDKLWRLFFRLSNTAPRDHRGSKRRSPRA